MAGTMTRTVTRGEEGLPDVLQFMRVLWAVVHGLERRSKRMRRELGITGPQRLALRVLGLRPGITAGELAATLHVHPSTLTGILARLVAAGLVSRTGHPADRRRAVLRLTARGMRANRSSRGTAESATRTALAGVSGPDRQAARRVLDRLAAHLAP
jgi:DNA-binding MarR family transcriptional regulator